MSETGRINGRNGAKGGRRPVKDNLLHVLVDKIVSGEIAEGSTLPNEAELKEHYGVSRTTLRESMQHLVAQGMVRSRTRAGTIVMPREQWNYLDPIVLDAAMRHPKDERFYKSLVDARLVLEPAAAAAAAENATTRQIMVIAEAFDDMVAAHSLYTDAWSDADLEFHTAIINASGNWVFRQFATAIGAALLASFRITNRASQSHERALDIHRAVLEAIRMRDREGARRAMEVLVNGARRELAEALSLGKGDMPILPRKAPVMRSSGSPKKA
ncbi:DNA-binding transcriptional regulator, FadR family [Xaviernesmea oryzae]|uniref:DNA-binding transcriptional regulator, FadR family n=1 Tax=Xaviernesmea oryzae TaxID=464029 RepID=A0A1X7DRY8_9HYPH|nr:FadR/GntR family transcriptional regulator [Xaviernesmea oryzae]SMF20594.1 DNA-binding transcriptional regulator, FadR family [Xaviernesmea oryzae]